jgi:hypothetical protein
MDAVVVAHRLTNYNLVVHGLNYHGSQPSSTFKHSLAWTFMYGMSHTSKLKVFAHPKVLKKHLAEMREDKRLDQVRVLNVNGGDVAHGMVVLQPMSVTKLALKDVVPMVPLDSRRKVPPFHLFDPLCRYNDEQIASVQKLTKTQIEVIRNP